MNRLPSLYIKKQYDEQNSDDQWWYDLVFPIPDAYNFAVVFNRWFNQYDEFIVCLFVA